MKKVRLVKHIFGEDPDQPVAQVYYDVMLPVFPYPSLIVQLPYSAEQIVLVGYEAIDAVCGDEGAIEALVTPLQDARDGAIYEQVEALKGKGWQDTQMETAVDFQEVIDNDITEENDVL